MIAVVAWSEWQALEKSYVANLPQSPGIYQVSCQATDCVVYIGSATGRGGLRQRLSQRVDNPKRYLSVYEKRLRQQNCRLMFRYAEATSRTQALDWETTEINEYRKHHGHLPPGNKMTPRRALDWSEEEFRVLLDRPDLADEEVAKILIGRSTGAIGVVRAGVHNFHLSGNVSMLSKMMLNYLQRRREPLRCPLCKVTFLKS